METIKLDNGNVDIVNYLAILSLEKIGIYEPTETEIHTMEKVLLISIKSGIARYSRKISNVNFSLLKKAAG